MNNCRFTLICLFFCLVASCQKPVDRQPDCQEFSILFWNLENFFDTFDDPLKEDDEFTPFGERHWNMIKYRRKSEQVWKVILSINPDQPPALIGLAEIENIQVLEDIFLNSAFGQLGYRIIHRDSPDRRGIDVALVYDPKRVALIDTAFIHMDYSVIGGEPGRDILRAKMKFEEVYFTLFINHWPSKYGGSGYTEVFRNHAASVLRKEADSLFRTDPEAIIICTGDFNDIINSKSITEILLKTPPAGSDLELRNAPPVHDFTEGTIKYQGRWEMIDHFFLSRNFFDGGGKLKVNDLSARIIAEKFLLEKDEKYGGVKPFRTWQAYTYRGGISDHLPILLRVEK